MASFASEEAVAISDALRRFCDRSLGESIHQSAIAPLTRPLWRSLGEMGVLALRPGMGTGENGLVAAALLALGRGAFPGPLPVTFLAGALLEPGTAATVAQGTSIVSVGPGATMPWVDLADIFIAIEGDQAVLIEAEAKELISTLGAENWARTEFTRKMALGSWKRFAVQYDLPLAAYLIGAAGRLLDETAAYAAERRQFGRPIGDFQGVALPLAAASTRIDAARNLLQVAADRLDAGADDAVALTAAVRRLASDAAREISFVAHQTFGAFGIIKNGAVFALSRRFQQWSNQEPAGPLPDDLIRLASGSSLVLSVPGLSEDDRCFLDEVRTFLEPFRSTQNYLVTQDHAASDRFYHTLAERNWLALAWPTEFGGPGKSRLQEFLLWNEIAFEGIARPPQGVGVIAKTIMAHGTEQQKAYWLDRIRRHDATFALAYSEPNAGSDLAGLTCRAVRDGDHYVITGNKCWNSKAHLVSHLWLLARTGEQAARGRGLSLFIVDTTLPGIEIRPIEQMDGNFFTEIFFTELRLPADCLVGKENDGWKMIGQALAEERHIHFGPGRVRADFRRVVEWAARTGLDQRQDVQVALRELAVEVLEAEAISLPMLRGADAVQAAANKVTHTRVLQSIARTAMDLGGAGALLSDAGIEVLWRQTMTETIGGGTTQIMQSIIARQRLGLEAKG
jgi:alkylation response protein AidB-like acyl-CoA dehydrogenase